MRLSPEAHRPGSGACTQRESATLFMAVLAGWQVLPLARYAGQADG